MDSAHILAVEDSDITLFKLKAILVRLGYTVTTYNNPVQALEWLKTSGMKPDLVMTDVMMPEMDGFDFVRGVRGIPALTNVPIIMLTAVTDVEARVNGLKAGADDYLSKSVTPTELELRVKALLARNQVEEATFAQSVARTITVFSQRGGVGTTSLAINLSISLAQLWGIEVCLWDLALGGGHCATMMNLKPKKSLAELHGLMAESIDEELLEKYLVKHTAGVYLMPSPSSVSEAELVTGRMVDQVLPFLQGRSSYLVVDAGNHLNEPVMNILERSDVILLTLAPDIASVQSCSDALNVFEQLGYDLHKVYLVINNIFPARLLPVKQIVSVLKNRPYHEIPYDSNGFVRGINTGEPLVVTAPKSEAGLAIISLAYRLSYKQMESDKKVEKTSPLLDLIHKLRTQ